MTIDRAQGCLMGQLAGDALGSLVEFQLSEEIMSKSSSLQHDPPAQPCPQRRQGHEGDKGQLAPAHLSALRRHREGPNAKPLSPGDEQWNLAAAGVAQDVKETTQEPEGGAAPDRFGVRLGEPREARQRTPCPHEKTEQKPRKPRDEPVRRPAVVSAALVSPDRVLDRIGKRTAQQPEKSRGQRPGRCPQERE